MKTSFQPEGNYYDKYHSANPIVKWMMRKFFNDFGSLLQQVGDIEDILEGKGCDFDEWVSDIAERINDNEFQGYTNEEICKKLIHEMGKTF